MDADERQALEKLLGYRLQNHQLFERALTHSSWAAEYTAKSGDAAADNERLEFLGDAVLALAVSEWLTHAFPLWREGQLSKARASLVNAGTLGEAARSLGLGSFLRLGRGEEKTGGREKNALLANAYEAVIGALFLDGGLDASRQFIESTLLAARAVNADERLARTDFKSRLQEILQARSWPAAVYRVIGEEGPDHRKVFEVEASVDGHASAVGKGTTKKDAEQLAARGLIDQFAEPMVGIEQENG